MQLQKKSNALTGWRPQAGTHRLAVPVYKCCTQNKFALVLSNIKNRLAPTGWRPQAGAHRLAPTGWRPQAGAHRQAPTGWRPQGWRPQGWRCRCTDFVHKTNSGPRWRPQAGAHGLPVYSLYTVNRLYAKKIQALPVSSFCTLLASDAHKLPYRSKTKIQNELQYL